MTVEARVEFDHLDEFEQAAQNVIDLAMEEGAASIVQTARTIVPVRTGHLQSSIHAVPTRTGWRVAPEELSGEEVSYARFVEFGTRYMAAQPFIRPAYERHRVEITRHIAQALWRIARQQSRP